MFSHHDRRGHHSARWRNLIRGSRYRFPPCASAATLITGGHATDARGLGYDGLGKRRVGYISVRCVHRCVTRISTSPAPRVSGYLRPGNDSCYRRTRTTWPGWARTLVRAYVTRAIRYTVCVCVRAAAAGTLLRTVIIIAVPGVSCAATCGRESLATWRRVDARRRDDAAVKMAAVADGWLHHHVAAAGRPAGPPARCTL